jgi:hypothetical protein
VCLLTEQRLDEAFGFWSAACRRAFAMADSRPPHAAERIPAGIREVQPPARPDGRRSTIPHRRALTFGPSAACSWAQQSARACS